MRYLIVLRCRQLWRQVGESPDPRSQWMTVRSLLGCIYMHGVWLLPPSRSLEDLEALSRELEKDAYLSLE
jgi:hypothetical protein